jgi:hypothetical protein
MGIGDLTLTTLRPLVSHRFEIELFPDLLAAEFWQQTFGSKEFVQRLFVFLAAGERGENFQNFRITDLQIAQPPLWSAAKTDLDGPAVHRPDHVHIRLEPVTHGTMPSRT